MKMMILTVLILTITIANVQGYIHINCDYANERDDIYVNENAWFECKGRQEILRFCIICDNRSSRTTGEFITRAVLRNLKRSRDTKGDEKACNDLKPKSCNWIKNQIDHDDINTYSGFTRKSHTSHFRRYDGREMIEY